MGETSEGDASAYPRDVTVTEVQDSLNTFEMSDADLTALALAADPDAAVADDAVCLWDLAAPGDDGPDGDGPRGGAPLPEWYMPAPMGVRRFSGWRRRLVRATVFLVIAAFIAINAYGLCNTYGQLSFG